MQRRSVRLLAAVLFLAVGMAPLCLSGQSQVPNVAGIFTRGRCVPSTNPDICPDRQSAAAQRTGPGGLIMLDKFLAARAKAFRDSFDEVAVPKYDCVQTPLPTLLTDPYAFKIEPRADRVIITYEKDDIVRTIWLEGHGHPEPKLYEFFPHGYSTGRYEGNQFVIETTKFNFDPLGLDNDFGNVPSSTQKRLIERYSRQGERLRADLRIEDPIFLLAPIEYSIEWQPTDQPLVLPWNCDPESAKQNLIFQPTKYPDPKE